MARPEKWEDREVARWERWEGGEVARWEGGEVETDVR